MRYSKVFSVLVCLMAAAGVQYGATVSVGAGGNLQAAINAAAPGDTIVLQAGATYTGQFTLPVKYGTGFVTITSSRAASLPAGQRVTPQSSVYMARVVSPSFAPAFAAAPGAHHYRLIGFDVTCAAGVYCNTLIQVGSGSEKTDAALPYDIELDRLYVHAGAAGGKRGVQLNGKRLTLRNSHLSGFRSSSQETQGVCAWNTPGPLTISNNRIEAGSIGILLGGAEPALVGVTPSDIRITTNYITRPLSWRSEPVLAKSLVELKAGRRVTISGNVLENTWTQAQIGYALNIKPGGENVVTPAITSDIVVADNIVRHTAGFVVLTGRNTAGGYVSRVTIRNNLLEDMGPAWGSSVPLIGLNNGTAGVRIENNTAAPSVLNPSFGSCDGGVPATGFVFRANILPYGKTGFKASGLAVGIPSLAYYFPGYVFAYNVLYGATVSSALYPYGNYFPVIWDQIGWTDPANGNYLLSELSLYNGKGTSGADPGVNYDALISATRSSLTGR